jgi:hypothetical protein
MNKLSSLCTSAADNHDWKIAIGYITVVVAAENIGNIHSDLKYNKVGTQ